VLIGRMDFVHKAFGLRDCGYVGPTVKQFSEGGSSGWAIL